MFSYEQDLLGSDHLTFVESLVSLLRFFSISIRVGSGGGGGEALGAEAHPLQIREIRTFASYLRKHQRFTS